MPTKPWKTLGTEIVNNKLYIIYSEGMTWDYAKKELKSWRQNGYNAKLRANMLGQGKHYDLLIEADYL